MKTRSIALAAALTLTLAACGGEDAAETTVAETPETTVAETVETTMAMVEMNLVEVAAEAGFVHHPARRRRGCRPGRDPDR
jgi:PBP1b-binding outer membrane lipoprotein LpoB